ncbi:MAG: hypothetical protein C4532_15595 [Candidatus Abyssobacteria bacterium SURF_17]|uniref:Uncharacterized protein n=1 Tax=Candidatus Abyssobacteria bacterium SURF_17 TaxID=2093361 RepID=A0A419ESY3_9BACT|nr:MAG: hypothetical protein C4532_15595 [Candidatus Abyssubacteria bacterium SURF_17]
MTRKEVHDVANIVAPALSLSQNLLLGFHGDLVQEQRDVVTKIERCLKELQGYLQQQATKERKRKE